MFRKKEKKEKESLGDRLLGHLHLRSHSKSPALRPTSSTDSNIPDKVKLDGGPDPIFEYVHQSAEVDAARDSPTPPDNDAANPDAKEASHDIKETNFDTNNVQTPDEPAHQDVKVVVQDNPSPGTKETQESVISTSARLWNAAYDSLQDDDGTKDLMIAYMKILEKVLADNKDDDPKIPTDLKGAESRQKYMQTLLESGKKKVALATKITQGIGTVADFILSVKDIVDFAVKSFPQAALPWAGVCIGLEILARPGNASKSNLSGIAHVASRMKWYCALSEHIVDESTAKIGQHELSLVLKEVENRIISLYKALLLYQVKTIYSRYRNQFIVFLRESFSVDDWDAELKTIKSSETAVETDVSKYCEQHSKKALSELVKVSGETEAILGDLKQTVQEFVVTQKEARRDDMETACQRDLFVIDPHDSMNRIENGKDKLFPDAYEWIMDAQEYKDFTTWDTQNSAASHRVLWIKGLAGTGKTMHMIGIIRKLSSQPAAMARKLSYYFCEGTNKNLSTPIAVLRSLIWLLLVQKPELISHLLQKHKKAGSELFTDPNAFFALSDSFESMLRDENMPSMYFVVDALDECEGHQELFALISRSLTWSDKIKWLVSSRPEVNPGPSFKPDDSIELDTHTLQGPVSAYIKHKIAFLEEQFSHDKEVVAEIKEEIFRKSDHTFLWVSLVFKELEKVESWDAIDTVKEMPSTLTELYGHMLGKIKKQKNTSKKHCINVLISCFLAARPLTIHELPIVADLDKADKATTERVRVMAQSIIVRCSSFVGLTDGIVHLVHQSAWDYLKENYAKLDPGPDGMAIGHAGIFSRSLFAMSNLLERNPWKLDYGFELSDDTGLKCPLDEDPLAPLHYSCVYWATHLRSADPGNLVSALADDGPVHQFLKTHILHWLESLSLLGELAVGMQSLTSILEAIKKIANLYSQLALFLEDSRRFFLANSAIIREMPVQTYISALIFSPTHCKVRELFKEEPDWIKTKPVVTEEWDACTQTLEGHIWTVTSVVFSPDGNQLASGSDDKTVKVWDVASGECTQTLEGHSHLVRSVVFSPDGKQLASGLEDKTVKVWDVASEACTQTFEGHSHWVTCHGPPCQSPTLPACRLPVCVPAGVASWHF